MVTHFESGAIRDSQEGKEEYQEAISDLTLRRYALYMLSQAKKYGKGNWKKGISSESYSNSLDRHLNKYRIKKNWGIDIEPGVDHLSAALFNLQGLIHNEEMEKYKKSNTPMQ